MNDPFDAFRAQLRTRVEQRAVSPHRPAESPAAATATHRSRRTDRMRAWLRGGRFRAPLLALVVAGGVGGVAYAAQTLLLRPGAPVPESPRVPTPRFTAGHPRVVVTVADPVGGLPWGLAAFRDGHGLTCAFVGRTQAGEVGVVGTDGAFGGDGRFHSLGARSTKSMACGGGDPAIGQFIMSGAGPPIPAHGYTGDLSLRVAGRLVAGCTPPGERRERGSSACAPAQMRVVRAGFAGGDAVRVSYGNRRVRRTIVPPRGSAGAYLFVFQPGEGAGGGPRRLRVVYADGTSCESSPPEFGRDRMVRSVPCPRSPQTHEPQTLLMP